MRSKLFLLLSLLLTLPVSAEFLQGDSLIARAKQLASQRLRAAGTAKGTLHVPERRVVGLAWRSGSHLDLGDEVVLLVPARPRVWVALLPGNGVGFSEEYFVTPLCTV